MPTFTTAITPVVSAAVNPNVPKYQSYVAGEYAQGAPKATFTTALFDQTWKPVQNAQGQSQYDIARGGLEAATQRNAQLRQDALQRQMASQGLTQSGINIKQGQIGAAQTEQALASGMAGINVAELQAAETARQAAMARQFGAETLGVQNAQETGERLGGQAFTGGEAATSLAQARELAYANLSMEEKSLAQNAQQFTDKQSFDKWALEQGWSQDAINRSWTAEESAKNRALTRETTTAQLTTQERINQANITSNEKINTNKDALTAQGLSIESARTYGFTDSNGQHVAGSIEVAAQSLGLQEKTLEAQQRELWGWDDGYGHHAGKYDLLSAEDKRSADQLYGYRDPRGNHVRGTLENDSLIADLKSRETQVAVDTYYGYVDPTTGKKVMGSGEIAAKAFGLQSTQIDMQRNELYGMADPKTGEWIPGKMELLSNDDKRAIDQLYGYTDAITGLHVMGTLELQADKNAIDRAGLTLEQARVQGYTDDKGVYHPGELQLQQDAEANKKTLMQLDYDLKSGLLDKQKIIDADAAVQKATADRYYQMGLNGEALNPQDALYISKNNPLAYQSYLMGKEGKTGQDLATAVEQTNQYRAAMITNLDDPAVQNTVTAMFASWGVESAKEATQTEAYVAAQGQAITGSKDFSTLDTGKTVLLTANTVATNGVTIKPGSYSVLKTTGTHRGKWDAMKGDWLTETGEITYLVDGSGNKQEVGFSKTSTAKGGDWWNNCGNPLSADFWHAPFGIRF